MPRPTFPYEDDKDVIKWFLVNAPANTTSPVSSHHMHITPAGALHMSDPLPHMVAHYEPDGSISGHLTPSTQKLHYVVRVINHIWETLGDERRIIMRPRQRSDSHAVFIGEGDVAMVPTIDDVEIPINTPITIAGRLSIMAWRSGQRGGQGV